MDLKALERRLAQGPPSESPAASAAVALILAPGEGGKTEFLLVERAVHPTDRWSGHIGLPGGRREGKEGLRETAERETREETSIDLSGARLLGLLPDVEPLSRPQPPLAVRPFVYALDQKPRIRLDAELAGYLWFRLPELRSCAGRATVTSGGGPREVDAFVCGSYLVWGMTYRILSQFLDAVESA
jgi:8-oxo-dGTP pyrophosphatase MutT (NUDIX family)